MSILGRFGGAFGFGKAGGGGGGMSATASGTLATPTTGLRPGNGYVYHTFIGPGTLTVTKEGTAEVMVIGGGGGGAGHAASGGGGAGGVAYNPRLSLTAGTSYSVTVGDGGAVGPNHSTSYQGSNSTFSGGGYTITGLGGGRAGRYSSGDSGGSGGGASGYPVPNVNAGSGTQSWQSQPAGTLNFGNVGGVRYSPTGAHAGSGGGGAGSAGENAPGPAQGGRGGEGLQFPQFTGPQIGLPALAPLNGYFAAGGGAGGWSGETGGTGGTGGGGSGFGYGNNGSPGVDYTGSGGGGGNGPSNSGGAGGKGIVVIRYPEVQWPTAGNGLSVSSPGTSAYQIKKDNPNAGDGFYYIQGASGVILVYCDMTYDGGGWMHIHRSNNGATGASQTSVRSSVGSITGATPGTTTGSIPSTYKIADEDINYWMQNCIVGTDRPSGHNLPCFRAHHNDFGPTGGAVDYFTVATTSVYGARTAFGNASIDFRGGPNYTGNGYGGSMSVAGWDTYASFTSSPNNPPNNSGYSSSLYGWGTQLFYNHNTWGNQTIYNSTSNGFYTGGQWVSTGGLWYR